MKSRTAKEEISFIHLHLDTSYKMQNLFACQTTLVKYLINPNIWKTEFFSLFFVFSSACVSRVAVFTFRVSSIMLFSAFSSQGVSVMQ